MHIKCLAEIYSEIIDNACTAKKIASLRITFALNQNYEAFHDSTCMCDSMIISIPIQ